MTLLRTAGCLTAALLLFACTRGEENPPLFQDKAQESLRLVSYHLYDWMLLDRDGDFQKDDPKPQAEQQAIIQLLKQAKADILLLRGLGSAKDAAELSARLQFPHVLCPKGGPDTTPRLAALSRQPIRLLNDGSTLTYRIKDEEYSLAGRFQHLVLHPDTEHPVEILHIDLKDKSYHPAGQSEMRRNEARLIRQYLASRMRESPDTNVLLAGTLNDGPDSAILREIREAAPGTLVDARPTDLAGSSWTVHLPESDQYLRTDYLLHHFNDTAFSTYLPETQAIGRHSPFRPMLLDLQHPKLP